MSEECGMQFLADILNENEASMVSLLDARACKRLTDGLSEVLVVDLQQHVEAEFSVHPKPVPEGESSDLARADGDGFHLTSHFLYRAGMPLRQLGCPLLLRSGQCVLKRAPWSV